MSDQTTDTGSDHKLGGDVFDRLDELVIAKDNNWASAEKREATVKLLKPSPQAIFRVSTKPDDHFEVFLLKTSGDSPLGQDYYLIPRGMQQEVTELGTAPLTHRLYLAVRRPYNTPFVIPARLPAGMNERADICAEDFLGAITAAQKSWVRVGWNKEQAGYLVIEIENPWPEPSFPRIERSALLRQLFGTARLIDSVDHPAFKKLAGRA